MLNTLQALVLQPATILLLFLFAEGCCCAHCPVDDFASLLVAKALLLRLQLAICLLPLLFSVPLLLPMFFCIPVVVLWSYAYHVFSSSKMCSFYVVITRDFVPWLDACFYCYI